MSLLGGFVFLTEILKSNSLESITKTKRKITGEDDIDTIELAVLEKEHSALLANTDNLSDAQKLRLEEISTRSRSVSM